MFINKIRHKRDTFTSVNNAFRNEKGAIDLASIMVGIIVIGLIGGVIAATVFAVIPWAQDNAAKHQLDSVVQAENAYFGLSAAIPSPLPEGSPTNSFSNSPQLDNANLLIPGSRYCAVATDGGKHFAGYSQSASGKIFWATDTRTKPEHLADATSLPEACAYINKNYIDGTDIIPDPSDGSGNGSGDGNGEGGGNDSEDGYFDSDGNWIPYDKGQIPNNPKPIYTSGMVALTLKCDADTTGSLGFTGKLQGTEEWSDGVEHTYDPKYITSNKTTSRALQAGVEYEVIFNGSFTNFVGSATLQPCLRSVDHIGSSTGITSLSNTFQDAVNLTSVPESIPGTVTNMHATFMRATSFNDPNVGLWSTSNVTVMTATFQGATSFNQPLPNWSTLNVTNMTNMFNGATAFNSPLDNFNTSQVTNMTSMFQNATSFNKPLNKWNVGKLSTASSMFYDAKSFNSPIFTVGAGTTRLEYMFHGATSFNQNVSNWNVANVTVMHNIFKDATAFYQDLSKWNTKSITGGNAGNFANLSTFPFAFAPAKATLYNG